MGTTIVQTAGQQVTPAGRRISQVSPLLREEYDRDECARVWRWALPRPAKKYRAHLSPTQLSRMRKNGEVLFQMTRALDACEEREQAEVVLAYLTMRVNRRFATPMHVEQAYVIEQAKDSAEDIAAANARCLSDVQTLKAWRDDLLAYKAVLPDVIASVDARIMELEGA